MGRAALLLAALSLALNLPGITWGLPARWHPDEKADVVARMIQDGSLDPGSFINPSLPLYLLLPAVVAQSRLAQLGLIAGAFGDPLLLARALSAVAGAAAVLLLGRLAARVGLGLVPPLLLAVAPGFVNLCHFATPEPWLLLGTCATLVIAVGHLEGRAPAWALGLAVGLTASTKYTAAALLAPALAAASLRPSPSSSPSSSPRGRMFLAALGFAALCPGLALASGLDTALAARLLMKDARLLRPELALGFVHAIERASLGAGAALLALAALAKAGRAWVPRLARAETAVVLIAAATGFIVGTPYALLHPVAFLTDLAFDSQTQFEYKGLVGPRTSFLPYLGLLGDAMTWPSVAAAAAGALVAFGRVLRGESRAAVILTAALAPYLLVASSGHQALRFLAPVLPAAALLAADGLSILRVPGVRLATTGLVVARAALSALLIVRLFHVDSRRLAARWMASHIPRGARIDLIANSPGYAPAAPEGTSLRIVPTLSRELAPTASFAEAARAYASGAAPWLVLTASYYERFLEHAGQRPERAAFFHDLLEGRGGFDVVARFRQEGWRRPPAEFLDPEIVILRKKES